MQKQILQLILKVSPPVGPELKLPNDLLGIRSLSLHLLLYPSTHLSSPLPLFSNSFPLCLYLYFFLSLFLSLSVPVCFFPSLYLCLLLCLHFCLSVFLSFSLLSPLYPNSYLAAFPACSLQLAFKITVLNLEVKCPFHRNLISDILDVNYLHYNSEQ